MMRSATMMSAVALGAVLGLTSAASAQTVHRHPRHPVAEGPLCVLAIEELRLGPQMVLGQRFGVSHQ